MWPDRVSNPGPLTYKSDALPTALHSLPPLIGKNLLIQEQFFPLRVDPMWKSYSVGKKIGSY